MVSITRRARIEALRISIQKVTRMLTKSSLPVILAGGSARVEYSADGKPSRVFLPVIPDNASDQLIDAVQGFVDHEVGHVLFSDFNCLLEAKKMGIALLLNAVEDTFIERKMASVYGGTRVNIARMRDLFIERFIDPAVQESIKKGITDVNKWWGLLGVCAIRAWAGHTEFVSYMRDKWKFLGQIPEQIKKKGIPDRLQRIENTEESLRIAIRISQIVEEAKKAPPESDEDESDENEDESGNSKEKKSQKSSKSKKALKAGKEEGEEEGEAGGGEEGEEEGEEGEEEGEAGGGEEGESKAGKVDEDEASEGSDGPPDTFKDEEMTGIEDFLSKVVSEEAKRAQDASSYTPYTRDADVIEKLDEVDVQAAKVEDMEHSIRSSIAPVQRALANAFESRNRSFLVHAQRDGRLSGTSLHRLLTNDDRVYCKKKESRTRESAVQLVVDISGSMRGAKINLAAKVAWALIEVLDRLKVPNEVICFTQTHVDQSHREKGSPFADFSGRRGKYSRYGPIYMPIIKSWDEPHFTANHKRLLTHMAHSKLRMLGNIDGESLQYAALRLMEQPQPGRVMVVLSDGQPAGDADYHATCAHLKQVVKDLERSGINVVGIGVEDDSVRHFYSKYVVVKELDDLASTVIGQVRDALLAP